jgi:hypothetical protein
VLSSHKDLSMKWKLKVAIDCAIGMKYASLLFILHEFNSLSPSLPLPPSLPPSLSLFLFL